MYKELTVAKNNKESSDKKASNQPNALVRYLRETRGEMRKVTWPTRQESTRLTGIVIGVTLIFAAFLWLVDFIFSNSLHWIIELFINA